MRQVRRETLRTPTIITNMNAISSKVIGETRMQKGEGGRRERRERRGEESKGERENQLTSKHGKMRLLLIIFGIHDSCSYGHESSITAS